MSSKIQAVHLTLDNNFSSAEAISQLRDFLFEKRGNCSVYFHIDTGNNPFIVKANNQLGISAEPNVLNELRDISFVKDLWTE